MNEIEKYSQNNEDFATKQEFKINLKNRCVSNLSPATEKRLIIDFFKLKNGVEAFISVLSSFFVSKNVV